MWKNFHKNPATTPYATFTDCQYVKMHAQNVNIPHFSPLSPDRFAPLEGALGPVEAGPSFPQTPDSARQWFRDHGITIKVWAQRRGHRLQTVKDLLRGKIKGERPEAHAAAVDLGLKPAPVSHPQHVLMLQSMEAAKKAILELDAQGVEIIGMTKVFPPEIHVRPGPAVEPLRGEPGPVTEIEGIPVQAFTAKFGGCVVRWVAPVEG